MTRRNKGGHKSSSRRMVRSKWESSDESDEDYMVGEDEEFEESEDEYNLTFDGEESDEILGELEEEEFVGKKIKKSGRPNVKADNSNQERRRRKNRLLKPERKRVYYRDLEEEEEEEEDDDGDDEDYDFDDERIARAVRPRKRKRAPYRDADGFVEGTDEVSDGEKVNEVENSREKKKGVLYREEDDDDCDGTDGKFDDLEVDKVVKPRRRRMVSYTEDEDDLDIAHQEDFHDDKLKIVRKPRGKRRVSYKEVGDGFDVTHEDNFDDDAEKGTKVGLPKGRKWVSYREEDDLGITSGNLDVEKEYKAAMPRKKKDTCYREEDDDYDGMDDDDDDEEFTPDEIDVVDDEEEFPLMKKKKVGRPVLLQKRRNSGQKRKRNSRVLKKNKRMKPRKNYRLRNSGDDEDFIDKLIGEEKNKKVNRRGRKRRLTVGSDSNFESPGSSDYEFTISEEEREQIREANEFCRSLTTSSKNLNLSKKLEEKKERLAQRKRQTRKGKEKVEDVKVEAGKQVCGICLTEEGKKTVRGTLNCCSHYFCFACIMEWSKVESRCPLCKQRFVTISKPARSDTGFDLRTVAIQIPERDQVYQPSEEELQGFLDPYDNVICTECHHGGDDALMLLCDLCDSPAHTYCVGLGREVPDGNWYCEGCRPAALGFSQVLAATPDHRTTSNVSVGSSPVSSIRETFDLNEMYVPDTPLAQESNQVPSPRPPIGDSQLPSPGSGSGAFTVLERRRIQRQIHHLLNNRRRQMDERTRETPTHSFIGFQVGRTRDLAVQQVTTPESTPSNNIFLRGSIQDSTMPLLNNRDVISTRFTHMREQPSQNYPSTSSNASFSGFLPGGFSGLNTRIELEVGHQQLQHYNNRPNIAADPGTSSYSFREATVPSRTLQDALHTQF